MTILVDRDADLRREMQAYLDTLTITGDNIGEIRRSLFMPFDSSWNGWVRDDTAERERPATSSDVVILDPNSERGQQIIHNAAFEGPTTQGDAPPQSERIFDQRPCMNEGSPDPRIPIAGRHVYTVGPSGPLPPKETTHEPTSPVQGEAPSPRDAEVGRSVPSVDDVSTATGPTNSLRPHDRGETHTVSLSEVVPASAPRSRPTMLMQLIQDIDEIRGAYGYLLMQSALSSDAEMFRIGKKQERRHRETFERLGKLLSRPGRSNHESWALLASEVVTALRSIPPAPKVEGEDDDEFGDYSAEQIAELRADFEKFIERKGITDAAVLKMLMPWLQARPPAEQEK